MLFAFISIEHVEKDKFYLQHHIRQTTEVKKSIKRWFRIKTEKLLGISYVFFNKTLLYPKPKYYLSCVNTMVLWLINCQILNVQFLQ